MVTKYRLLVSVSSQLRCETLAPHVTHVLVKQLRFPRCAYRSSALRRPSRTPLNKMSNGRKAHYGCCSQCTYFLKEIARTRSTSNLLLVHRRYSTASILVAILYM